MIKRFIFILVFIKRYCQGKAMGKRQFHPVKPFLLAKKCTPACALFKIIRLFVPFAFLLLLFDQNFECLAHRLSPKTPTH